MATRSHVMIRTDETWPTVEPMDMRAGTETPLVRVVKVFGAVHSHHTICFVCKPPC